MQRSCTACSLPSATSHLTAAIKTLTTRCVSGIEADERQCLSQVENSIGLVTALGPRLGYETASRIAKRAHADGCKVADIVLEEGPLTESELTDLLRIDVMTAPARHVARR